VVSEPRAGILLVLERGLVDLLPFSDIPDFDGMVVTRGDHVVFIRSKPCASDSRVVGILNSADDFLVFGVPELKHLKMCGAQDDL